MDALAGNSASPRHEFFYFNDDGSFVLRYNQWKIVFAEQLAHGFDVWQEPFTALRLPKIFNLRSDPFEGVDDKAMGVVWTLATRPRLRACARAAICRPVPEHIQGIPAEPKSLAASRSTTRWRRSKAVLKAPATDGPG